MLSSWSDTQKPVLGEKSTVPPVVSRRGRSANEFRLSLIRKQRTMKNLADLRTDSVGETSGLAISGLRKN
jgi:hypothetical protein